jgi:C4-dicarboxylate transporter, DctM subunit
MIGILIVFLILMAFGVPIVLALGFATTGYILIVGDIPIAVVAHRFYSGLNNFTLLAIPFFVLSGLLMEAGGLSSRIVSFANSLVGWIRGGLLMVAVIASTALAAMSGSGSADAAAVSAVLQPELRKRGYDIDFSAALIAASATLAQVIPPSLMLVIIAVQNNLSVGALFLGGVLPGLMACGCLLCVAYIHARGKPELDANIQALSAKRILISFGAAIPALGMGVIILGGILLGIMTPTEAAGISVVYALLVGYFVYGDLQLRDLPKIFLKAAYFSAGLLLLVATANVLNWLIADSGTIEIAAEWIGTYLDSPLVFLIGVNLLLMTLGMFIEGIALILLLGGLFIKLGASLGVDPHQMAVIIVLNCAIGLITPPFGATIFVSAMIAERPFLAVARRITLPWIALTLTLVAVSLLPGMTLALPRLAGFLN